MEPKLGTLLPAKHGLFQRGCLFCGINNNQKDSFLLAHIDGFGEKPCKFLVFCYCVKSTTILVSFSLTLARFFTEAKVGFPIEFPAACQWCAQFCLKLCFND